MEKDNEIKEYIEDFLRIKGSSYTPRDIEEAEFAFEVSHGRYNAMIYKVKEKKKVVLTVYFPIPDKIHKKLNQLFTKQKEHDEFRRELAKQLMVYEALNYELPTDDEGEIQAIQIERVRLFDDRYPSFQELYDDIQNLVNSMKRGLFHINDYVEETSIESLEEEEKGIGTPSMHG